MLIIDIIGDHGKILTLYFENTGVLTPSVVMQISVLHLDSLIVGGRSLQYIACAAMIL